MHQPAECPDSHDEDRPLALRCGCAPAVVAPRHVEDAATAVASPERPPNVVRMKLRT